MKSRTLILTGICVLGLLFYIMHTTAPVLSTMRGDALLEHCTSFNPNRRLLCDSYIAGLMDGVFVKAMKDSHRTGSPDGPYDAISQLVNFCLPEAGIAITSDNARQVVVNYLDESPMNLRGPAGVSVFLAMSNAFPCKQGGQSQQKSSR
jgi:hypothetical protein